MNWKDIKIAKKLYIGFGIVLILALAIGYVGYNGLTTVAKKVDIADDATQLVIWAKDMGMARTAYNSTKDRTHFETVEKKCVESFAQLDATMAKLEHADEREMVADIVKTMTAYQTTWGEWVAISEAASQSMKAITADANVLQTEMAATVEAQDKSLANQVSSAAGHDIIASELARTTTINSMFNDYLDLRVEYRNYLLKEDKQYGLTVLELVDRIVTEGEKVRLAEQDEQKKARLAGIVKAARGIGSSMKEVMARNDEFYTTRDNLGVVARDLVAKLVALQEDQSNESASAQASAVTLAISFVVGAILFGAMIAFFIARGVSRPVSQMAAIANDVAQGEIDHQIDYVAKDEIGVLAESFRGLIDYMKGLAGAAERIADNDLTVRVVPKSERDVLGNAFKTMVHNLTGMMRKLAESAVQLVSAATEISSSAEQMSRGAQDQSSQVTQVSSAVEEMTATIVESSRNAAEATEASKGASDTATNGGQIVNDTIHGMQKIAEVVRESADSIAKLAHSADQIGEIIGVIDDIADQTNLLALNAAIEAARAGEQGRGFAVVADEVRKLAERTGKATGEITDMIKGIQVETSDAVTSMEAGSKEVDSGRSLADQAGSSLNEIVAMSQRVMDMIQQIATATEEQSAAAEQISKNIEHVNSITKETATGAEQSAAAAEELNRQAEELQQMVALFRLSETEEAVSA